MTFREKYRKRTQDFVDKSTELLVLHNQKLAAQLLSEASQLTSIFIVTRRNMKKKN